jgi:small subunit ribosomal protein S2
VALVTVKELIDSGVHFGHQASRWNPKMAPFIYGKRNLIHIIDVQQTIRGLIRACHFLGRLAATGEQILIVGTKRQIRSVVESEAARCGMPCVTERWIGGTLTNFDTIRSRLQRLEEIELMESDGSMEQQSKKVQSKIRRELRKLKRNLEGMRSLNRLPGVLVVIDPRREDTAMLEAGRLNIPTVCLLDTDCDPDLVDIPIPGNDDAMRSVQLVLKSMVDAIIEGKANMTEQQMIAAKAASVEEPRGHREGGRDDRRGGGGGRGRRGPGGDQGRTGGRRPAAPAAGGRFAPKLEGRADAVSFGGSDESTPAAKADAASGPEVKPEPVKPEAAKPETAKPETAKPGEEKKT